MRLFKLLLLLVIIGFMGFSGYCRTEMSIMLTNLTNERLNKVKYTFGVTGSDPGEIVVGLGHVNGFGSYYSDAPPESKTISISPHDTLAIFQSSDCGTSINLKDLVNGSWGQYENPIFGESSYNLSGIGNQIVSMCILPYDNWPKVDIDSYDDVFSIGDVTAFCFVPTVELTVDNKTGMGLNLVDGGNKQPRDQQSIKPFETNNNLLFPAQATSKSQTMGFAIDDYNYRTGKYTSFCKSLNKTFTSGSFYKELVDNDHASKVRGVFVFDNIGVGYKPADLKVTFFPLPPNSPPGTLGCGSKAVTGVKKTTDGREYSTVDFTFKNYKDPGGLFIDTASLKPVYIGYGKPEDISKNNKMFIPNVLLPLPVYPARADITPVECCGLLPSDQFITGDPNLWNLGTQKDPSLKSFSYTIRYNPNNVIVLSQLNCDFTGMPGTKSVTWWKNAKMLTEIKEINIPDDIAKITGLYVDKASQKIVYVGDPTNVGNSIIFIPDVLLPIPAPPAYPRWGDITPMKCYNLESGYTLSGTRGLNRWSNGSNKLFLKKFSYYVTEDLNGNTMLIQGDCDFSGVPPSESVTWWKNAKVLIKK